MEPKNWWLGIFRFYASFSFFCGFGHTALTCKWYCCCWCWNKSSMPAFRSLLGRFSQRTKTQPQEKQENKSKQNWKKKKKVIGKAWKLWLGLITGGQLSERFCTASGLTSSIKVMRYRRPMAPTLTSQEAQKTAALVQRSKLRTLQYAKK